MHPETIFKSGVIGAIIFVICIVFIAQGCLVAKAPDRYTEGTYEKFLNKRKGDVGRVTEVNFKDTLQCDSINNLSDTL